MVTQSYGSYSPAAIDPFPIESVLAEKAITSPAQAQNLLDLYQTQRDTSVGNYNYAMQGQHDFAKQQLAQQLYEANLKALPEMAKPGVAGILAAAPQYQGVFGGASPDMIARSVGQAEGANQAETLQKAGAGANSFSQAGYGIPIPAIQGMTGVTGLTPQTPRDIEIAKINAAARLGAASIGASGGGAGPSFSVAGEPDPATGLTVTSHFPPKARMSPEQVLQYEREHGQTKRGLNEGGTGAEGDKRPAAAAAPGDKAKFDQVRQAVETHRGALGDAAYKDITEGYKLNGGNPLFKRGADGKDHLTGASGKPYS